MENEYIRKIFDNAFGAYAKGIFRFVYFKVSDYELAEDITEDTFVRFWKVLVAGKQVDNQKALVYFIAKGLVVDYYRRNKHSKHVSLEKIDERLLQTRDAMEDTLSHKGEIEQIYKKVRQLKKTYQDIIFLHFVEDLTVKEIAYIQKKKENAVRVLLHRALQKIKELL